MRAYVSDGDRLLVGFPRVAGFLDGLDMERVQAFAQVLSQATVERCAATALVEASSDPAALVAGLDELAWSMQQQEDTGAVATGSYRDTFRRARAVDSWQRAFSAADESDARDAIYEALHGLGGDAAAEDIAISILATA